MPGKRVQFDWQATKAVTRQNGRSFQELADEAFKDLLKKHKQPVGLKAALEERARGSEANRGGRPNAKQAELLVERALK
jgi:hypothetical protein